MPEETSRNGKNNILYLVPISILLAGFLIAGAVFVGGRKEKVTGGAAKSERAELPAGETSPEGKPEVAGAQVFDVSVDDDPSWGPKDAPVTIIEFSEYQCPYCKRYIDDAYAKIKAEYPGKIRYVFRDFPLEFHANAKAAAVVAECAGKQDKYFEMHDLLFENQETWSAESSPTAAFEGYAGELDLDLADFKACLADLDVKAEIEKDYQDGIAVGVNGTPAFFINGRMLVGAQPFSEFKKVIDEELAK